MQSVVQLLVIYWIKTGSSGSKRIHQIWKAWCTIDSHLLIIALPVIYVTGVVIYVVINVYREKERRRSIVESQRELERQKREYIERKQKEAEEHRRIQKPIDDAKEELSSAFTKAESSIKRAIKAVTVKHHIEIMEEALSAYYSKVPTGYSAGAYYERAIKSAKSRYEKMLTHEKHLSPSGSARTSKCYRPSSAFAEERKKLTVSMRYNVLNRDGHRCCICGRDASDGVKLHVDHIIPVSKGGKTEMSNLRTLCADCNLGKGAKLEVIEIHQEDEFGISPDEFVEKYIKPMMTDTADEAIQENGISTTHAEAKEGVQDDMIESKNILLFKELIRHFDDEGIEYVDKTANGGSLYFFSETAADDLKSKGYPVYFAEQGTKGTKHRPAWYIKL